MGVDLGMNQLGKVLGSLGLTNHLNVLAARLHVPLEANVSFPLTGGEKEQEPKHLS